MVDIVLVTQQEYVSPVLMDEYHQHILLEDQILADALHRNHKSVIRVAWDDESFDWTNARIAIIRATWDYFHRIEEFQSWLIAVNNKTVLINPYSTIRWNLDKRYLRDMLHRGINIPETIFLETGEDRSLTAICQTTNWTQWVLKPAISGAARHTYLLTDANLEAHEHIFRELISREQMLLQRFQPNVTKMGEWTLVLINGRYSHAVLKRAKAGDFRVQDDFGGTVHDHEATIDEIRFAEHAMSLVDPIPVYGRVDLIRDVNGDLALQELELIEPELWFRNCPKSADLLAQQLAEYLAIPD